MIDFIETSLPGVFLVKPRIAQDLRGRFIKLFHAPTFSTRGLSTEFAEFYYSVNVKSVVRGMHLQLPPMDHAKLVSCSFGSALDVLLDLRQASPTFQRTACFNLDGDTPFAIYIPPGVAHGFAATSDGCVVTYMVTSAHSPEHDTGVLWSSFGFIWPFANPIISARDAALAPLSNFDSMCLRRGA